MSGTDSSALSQGTPAAPPAKGVIVELKNGKLNLRQKLLAFDKMSETMQEIVQFREMLEKRIEEQASPMDEISDQHMPLIAKLVHESDKTIVALAKHVHNQLIPAQDEDDEDAVQASMTALPIQVLDRAIKFVADRVNYGLEVSIPGAKVVSGWHIWRWEVKVEHRSWLPKVAKEKVEMRYAERIQARKDVQSLFNSLPEQERKSIINIKEVNLDTMKIVTPVLSQNVKNVKSIVNDASGNHISDSQNGDADRSKAQEDSSASAGPSKPKKPVDPEKVAKEKEREEKKQAKVEKEKKAKAAQEKSRSMMASFFTKTSKAKPAPAAAGPSRSTSLTKDSDPSSPGSSSTQSDYSKTFKPFTVKRDVELASMSGCRRQQNKKFRETRDLAAGTTIIVIDDDDSAEDVQMRDMSVIPDLGQKTAEERLKESLASLLPTSRRPHIPPSGLKTYHPHVVRNILNQLNEAEIAGDDQRVRSLLQLLRDRTSIPAKVLIFTEDARPGYFGTWTRNSREVGPRTPFSRDVVAVDYTYDSGEEWEEESGDADDVVEGADEDGDDEDRDSDLDSWLVDDDEVEEPGTPVQDRELSPGMPPVLPLPKRKSPDDEKKTNKRRKVVVPLVPFVKGPCWEDHVGQCTYDPFKQYRVQLLNDTPFPIDPFKFVATPVSIPLQDRKMVGQPSDTLFAVPALPERLVKRPTDGTTSNVSTSAKKRAPAVLTPKTTFPDEHLQLLISKIQTMQTGNITGIVETVYQELRAHKVKKNAIEAKLREIGEKSKEKKVWVLKSAPLQAPVNSS